MPGHYGIARLGNQPVFTRSSVNRGLIGGILRNSRDRTELLRFCHGWGQLGRLCRGGGSHVAKKR